MWLKNVIFFFLVGGRFFSDYSFLSDSCNRGNLQRITFPFFFDRSN